MMEEQVMKKYIKPTIDVIVLNTSNNLLVGSIGINSTESAVDASNAAARRRGGFWDEEDDY